MGNCTFRFEKLYISFSRLYKSIEYFFNYDLYLFFRERNPIHSLKVAEPQAHISKV